MHVRAKNNFSNLRRFIVKRLNKPIAQTAPEGIKIAIQVKQFKPIAVFEEFAEVVLKSFQVRMRKIIVLSFITLDGIEVH